MPAFSFVNNKQKTFKTLYIMRIESAFYTVYTIYKMTGERDPDKRKEKNYVQH